MSAPVPFYITTSFSTSSVAYDVVTMFYFCHSGKHGVLSLCDMNLHFPKSIHVYIFHLYILFGEILLMSLHRFQFNCFFTVEF